jgi:hypothetical protein
MDTVCEWMIRNALLLLLRILYTIIFMAFLNRKTKIRDRKINAGNIGCPRKISEF